MHDWDSTQVPVLADLTINGTPRKTMLFANRNGFFYVLDRTNGRMIFAKPFVTQNWAKEISPEGRPILVPGTNPSEEGSVKVCPDLGGGTNFFSPSYDPNQRLFFVNARETCAIYYSWHEPFREGEQYESGGTTRPREQRNYGALRAIDPLTGDRKWEFRYPDHVFVRHPVDGVGPGVLGRRRRQYHRARLEEREVSLALPTRRRAPLDRRHDLYGRRQAVSAGAVGQRTDGVRAAVARR